MVNSTANNWNRIHPMKKILFSVLLFTAFFSASAQVFKFNAHAMASRQISAETDHWTDWSPWEDTDLDVIVDTKSNQIRYVGGLKLFYTILEIKKQRIADNGDIVTEIVYDDELGERCTAQFVKPYSEDASERLYVKYDSYETAYKISEIH